LACISRATLISSTGAPSACSSRIGLEDHAVGGKGEVAGLDVYYGCLDGRLSPKAGGDDGLLSLALGWQLSR
jgi:hypothetical protein